MRTLLGTTGFLSYILVVFLNAFIDLGHKIVIQNTVFKVYDGDVQIMLTAVVNALILLPFILLFSPAGFISDKYPKNRVMRAAAWAAVGLTLAITACYYFGWFIPAFCLTFLLAVQSAFYSPAKYGYIKVLLGKERLGEGNGTVQAVTIIAILLGTFFYSIIFEASYDEVLHTSESAILQAISPIGWLLVANSLLQLFFAYKVPELEVVDESKKFVVQDYIRGKALRENLQPVISHSIIRLSIIGLMMFWSISQVMLATFPAFAKETLGQTNTVVIQGTLAASGIGIMLGALLAGRWSRRHIETGLIPLGAAGITLGLFMIPNIDSNFGHILNFVGIGIMGGFFIVPLNALIQFNAQEHEMGQVLAGNNLIQNIGMLSFLAATVVLSFSGASAVTILSLLVIVALAGSIFTVLKLPQSMVRFLLTYLMSRHYRVVVQGMRNLPERGGVLLLGNHISWIDWAIIQIASPRPIRFVMAKSIYQRWYLEWFFKLFGVIPIERGPAAAESIEVIAELLDQGDAVCLFPEGTISRTGHLAEFRSGYEKACARCQGDAVIVPFYLRGLWGSQFSRASEKLKTMRGAGVTREIIVAFGPPLPKNTQVDVLKRRVFDLSINSWDEYVRSLPTIPHAWITTAKHMGSDMALADTMGEPLSGIRALTGAVVFSRRMRKYNKGQNVGLLVPTSIGGVLANMAVLLAGKTVVNLNYSASQDALLAALDQADLECIFTSKQFVQRLEQRGVDVSRVLGSTQVYYLEEIKAAVPQLELLSTLLAVKILPTRLLQGLFCKFVPASDTAAILFSSGSEGAPKGVMLSHTNIMANLKQISDVLNMRSDDVVMAELPLFHAFGMTVTQFMPLIEGLPVVCHADPTDAMGVAKAVASYRATLFAGTSSLLRLYVKNPKIHPMMLDSLRLVIAGAEKLNEDVRDAFKLKFNKEIYEGYGATETTPVASVNLPDHLDTAWWIIQKGAKVGTVGMPLPGSSFKIVDPDSLEELETGEAGLIMIGGCQVMKGYLKAEEKTADVIVQDNRVRWYKTGDKGFIDRDGFLTIVDRYSRFAKIAGEMVGLGSVEETVRKVLADPELDIVAISLPDAARGERIILLYSGDIDGSTLKQRLIDEGVKNLMIPAEYHAVAEVPKLGSGKTDYGKARELAVSATTKS